MPRLSVWFIRFSLALLALGFTLGALMLGNEGLAINPNFDRLLPVHMEMLMMGWVMQLALGVAYWILPRFTQGLPRGNESVAWLSFLFINAGILLIPAGLIFNVAWLALIGRFCEAVSVLAFLYVAWGRVRSSA